MTTNIVAEFLETPHPQDLRLAAALEAWEAGDDAAYLDQQTVNPHTDPTTREAWSDGYTMRPSAVIFPWSVAR